MINNITVIKGRQIDPSEFQTLRSYPIPGVKNYFWFPDLDTVISMKGAIPYQMKRHVGYFEFAVRTESYYSLTRGTGNGQRQYLLSELRALADQPEEIKKEEKMKQEQYIVASILKVNGAWSNTTNPRIHGDLASAKTEAARLAKLSPDKKFVVLHVEGIVAVADVVWE